MVSPKEAKPIVVPHFDWAVKQIDGSKKTDRAAAEERQRLADWTGQFGPATVRVLKTYGTPATNPTDGRREWKTPPIPIEIDFNQTVPLWLEGVEDRTGNLTHVAIKFGDGDTIFQYVRGEVLTWKGRPPEDWFERQLGTHLLASLEGALAERQPAPSVTT